MPESLGIYDMTAMESFPGNHNSSNDITSSFFPLARRNVSGINGSFIANNSIIMGGGGGDFFDVYYSMPRFITETILAILSISCNTMALVVVCKVFYSRQTAYHRLFVNLALANTLTSILSWLCNNIMFLFRKQLITNIIMGSTICELFVYLMAGVLASTSFGIVSTLTMLGFTAVQYFAICRPLHHQQTVRQKRICCFLTCTWILSICIAIGPFLVLLYRAKTSSCDKDMLSRILYVVLLGGNASMGIISAAYLAIVALCVRIYVEIKCLQRRLSQFRFEQDVSNERKAFLTIIILLLTLTIFYVPYMSMYIITLNASDDGNMTSDALVYYMNLLPYLKFCTDPIIYGMRMREVREGCVRILRPFRSRKSSREKQELITIPRSSLTVTTATPTAV